MMSQQIYYLTGDFEGYYFTRQSSPLGAGEKLPGGNTHAVHVYRGKVQNAEPLGQYDPALFLDSTSLLLHNVNQIEANIPGVDKKIFDFDQLVINNVQVEQSWELDGKTYGILKGKIYAKIKTTIPPVKPPQPEQKDPIVKPVDPVPRPVESGTKDPNQRTTIPPAPNPPVPGPGGGGYTRNRGCWDTIWRILRWLLLLLLLLFLISKLRGCFEGNAVDGVNTDSLCIEVKDSLERKVDSLQIVIDSLQAEEISADSLQAELVRRKDSAGAHMGEITISLMWNTTDDLDLAIEQPNGKIIFFNNKEDSFREALFEIDKNRFDDNVDPEPIEHIYIKKPASGRYRVYVNWFKDRSNGLSVPYYLWMKSGEKIYELESNLYEVRRTVDVRNQWTVVYEFEY